MAKFIEAHSPGGGATIYRINVDQVTHVQQSKTDAKKCTVKFGDDRSIVIEMSAAEFAALADGAGG